MKILKRGINKILNENIIEKICYTGCFDEEDKEFIINGNYLYFKLGEKFICFEATESYSQLKISVENSII